MNLIDELMKKRKNLVEKKKEQLKLDKDQLITTLTTHWDEEFLRRYKGMLTIATTGALGNNSTEVDIKKMILASNRNLFSKEEYDELNEKLDLEKEKRTFKRGI